MKEVREENSESLVMLEYLFAAYRNQSEGKLAGLMSTYEDYGKPPGISPFDVFENPVNRLVIDAFLTRFPEDNIIEYRDDDILVNHHLLKVYLNILADEICSYEALWLEILGTCKEKYHNQIEVDKILRDFYADFKFPDSYDDLPI